MDGQKRTFPSCSFLLDNLKMLRREFLLKERFLQSSAVIGYRNYTALSLSQFQGWKQ
jgi:hypothetical protein